MPKPSIAQSAVYLRIGEIAELWAKETEVPAEVISRQLRDWLIELIINGERELPNPEFVFDPEVIEDIESRAPGSPVEENPPEESAFMSKSEVAQFCAETSAPRPQFWFSKQEADERPPGRPSVKKAILAELRSRADGGTLEAGLAEQARVLVEWADFEFPTVQTYKQKSMENLIREEFWKLTSDQKDPSN